MTVGEFVQKNIQDAYFLNAAGSHFVKADEGVVKAFEVYADNVTASDATQFMIVLDENSEGAAVSIRGDVNKDGKVAIDDVTELIDFLLDNDSTEVDTEAADCDLDSHIAINDVTQLIDFLLTGAW